MRFRDRIARFMYGRYGTDSLFYFLWVVYIALVLANVFVRSWVLYLLSIAVFIITFYRVLSRNTVKRMNENIKFQKLFKGVKGWFSNRTSRIKQNKNYCFKRCPNCGKVLRLPRVKGKHSTRCPVCHADFNVRVWLDKKK